MSDVIDDVYHEALLEEAKAPFHYGEMKDAHVIVHGSNASCGDVITIFYKRAHPENPDSPITDMRWTGSGCIISQVAASTVARLIITNQLSSKQAAAISLETLTSTLGLKNVSPNRIKCLLLAVNTLKLSPER